MVPMTVPSPDTYVARSTWLHWPFLSCEVRSGPITALAQSLSSAALARTNWALAVSLKNAGGNTSSATSGAGARARVWIWQNWPNCATHCAGAARAGAGVVGSGFGASAAAVGLGVITEL